MVTLFNPGRLVLDALEVLGVVSSWTAKAFVWSPRLARASAFLRALTLVSASILALGPWAD